MSFVNLNVGIVGYEGNSESLRPKLKVFDWDRGVIGAKGGKFEARNFDGIWWNKKVFDAHISSSKLSWEFAHDEEYGQTTLRSKGFRAPPEAPEFVCIGSERYRAVSVSDGEIVFESGPLGWAQRVKRVVTLQRRPLKMFYVECDREIEVVVDKARHQIRPVKGSDGNGVGVMLMTGPVDSLHLWAKQSDFPTKVTMGIWSS